jgi:hypothetical protein
LSYDQKPFEDVVVTPGGFSLPVLKWRELVFIGAVRAVGDGFTRDPARPMPPFARGDVFPVGAVFAARPEGGRIQLRLLRDDT